MGIKVLPNTHFDARKLVVLIWTTQGCISLPNDPTSNSSRLTPIRLDTFVEDVYNSTYAVKPFVILYPLSKTTSQRADNMYFIFILRSHALHISPRVAVFEFSFLHSSP